MQPKSIEQIMEEASALGMDADLQERLWDWLHSLLLEAERRLQNRHDNHVVKDERAVWDLGFRSGCAEGIQILRDMMK